MVHAGNGEHARVQQDRRREPNRASPRRAAAFQSRRCGLKGLTDTSDMREIERRAVFDCRNAGTVLDEQAVEALDAIWTKRAPPWTIRCATASGRPIAAYNLRNSASSRRTPASSVIDASSGRLSPAMRSRQEAVPISSMRASNKRCPVAVSMSALLIDELPQFSASTRMVAPVGLRRAHNHSTRFVT
jgi:hypothetical protein